MAVRSVGLWWQWAFANLYIRLLLNKWLWTVRFKKAEYATKRVAFLSSLQQRHSSILLNSTTTRHQLKPPQETTRHAIANYSESHLAGGHFDRRRRHFCGHIYFPGTERNFWGRRWGRRRFSSACLSIAYVVGSVRGGIRTFDLNGLAWHLNEEMLELFYSSRLS